MPLTSPYNFVPINRQVYYPSWGHLVSMDVPFEDGEDGFIEVTFKNVSPLFTRNGARQERDPKKKETLTSHIVEDNGKRRYFIPASTIKGMLRSTLEIMAFGKINESEHYSNRWFGYRDIAQETAESKEYINKVRQGRPGWLSKKGNQYFFTECDGELDKIPIETLEQDFPGHTNRDRTSIWEVNCSVRKDQYDNPVYPIYRKGKTEYQIVCSGAMGGKLHELLFPNRFKQPIELDEITIKAFKSVYEQTKDFNKFITALDRKQKVPVFYLFVDGMKFPVIGLSRMFRIPSKNSLTDMIRKEQDEQKDASLDLCETMFGRTSGNLSLKGRVQIGHAFALDQVDDKQLVPVEGILGQPKASYYPLYVKQNKNPYKTYDTGTALSGRKIYRVHKGATTTSLPQPPRGRNNMSNVFYALPAGTTFKLRINVHNLKKVEIGALLSALTIHETEGVFHNLGLAKSYGYGKLQIESVKLHMLRHSSDDYELAFEDAMDEFLSTSEGQETRWCDSKQLTMLVNILSEHEDKDVKLMTLKEYSFYKDTDNWAKLKEDNAPLFSFKYE